MSHLGVWAWLAYLRRMFVNEYLLTRLGPLIVISAVRSGSASVSVEFRVFGLCTMGLAMNRLGSVGRQLRAPSPIPRQPPAEVDRDVLASWDFYSVVALRWAGALIIHLGDALPLSSIIQNAPPPANLDVRSPLPELALSLVIAGVYGSGDRLLDSMAIADRPRLESRKSVTGALTETAIDLLPKPVAASGFRLLGRLRLLVFWGSGVKRKSTLWIFLDLSHANLKLLPECCY